MRSSSHDREVRIESDYLTLGRKKMAADVLEIPGSTELVVTPDQFAQTLKTGREAILAASAYRLRAIRFGDDNQSHLTEDYGPRLVFTQSAFDADNHVMSNHVTGTGDTGRAEHMQGVYVSDDCIKDDFHPYWHAAQDEGYVPEIRTLSGGKMGGAWMLLAIDHSR